MKIFDECGGVEVVEGAWLVFGEWSVGQTVPVLFSFVAFSCGHYGRIVMIFLGGGGG